MGLILFFQTNQILKSRITDNCPKREIIKYVSEYPPDWGTGVFPATFIVEPIDLGDLSGLVVPPDQVDSVGVSHLWLELGKYYGEYP